MSDLLGAAARVVGRTEARKVEAVADGCATVVDAAATEGVGKGGAGTTVGFAEPPETALAAICKSE